MNVNRRDFLKKAALGLLALPVARFLGMQTFDLNQAWAKKFKLPAPPKDQKVISEADPVASALGYKHNIAEVSNPSFKKGSNCSNCALYTKVDGHFGKCQMLTSGLVYSKGWCGSWSKKA